VSPKNILGNYFPFFLWRKAESISKTHRVAAFVWNKILFVITLNAVLFA